MGVTTRSRSRWPTMTAHRPTTCSSWRSRRPTSPLQWPNGPSPWPGTGSTTRPSISYCPGPIWCTTSSSPSTTPSTSTGGCWLREPPLCPVPGFRRKVRRPPPVDYQWATTDAGRTQRGLMGSADPRRSGAGSRRPRLLSLTSLRAFAAFAVFTRHASETFFKVGDHSSLTRQGATGVSFFFILSGFVLAWSYRPGDSAGRFYRRRFARIYPAYILMLVLTQVSVGTRHGFPLVPFLLNGTLVQSWVPSAKIFFTSDMGAWSLGCEAFFYLLFPLLLPLVTRAAPRRRWQVLALVGVVDLTVALATHSPSQASGFGLWLVYIFPVTRLGEFVVGLILAVAVAEGLRVRVSLNQALLVALAAYALAGLVPVYLMWEVFTLVPFSLLVLAA